MKRYLFLTSLLLIFWSCVEDVSRNINTDLTQEADQFFRFSEVLSESAYLGNISYSDYFRITSQDLPGCPMITRDTDLRIIQLDYSSSEECEHANKIPRTGKIILDFALSNTPEPSWTLTYENYTFGNTIVDGVRLFENPEFNENQETFEKLSIELEKNLGFIVTGGFSYSIAKLNFRPFALSTRGRIEGTNPAGRDFSLVITEAKEQLFSCYSEGWELPQSGRETWSISRSPSSSLDYMVRFESSVECDPTVTSTLPDGRTLELNP